MHSHASNCGKYAGDACPRKRTLERSLPIDKNNDEDVKANSKKIINSCQRYFGLPDAIKKT